MSRSDRDTDDRPTETRTTQTAGGGAESTLLWFSVAGAIIMGLLWIIDLTGVFGLTWTVLGATTTLIIAVVAAIGALLFWYDMRPGAEM